jgi:hypothetical protein
VATPGPPTDDLLSGFERTGPRQRELRAYLSTAMVGSRYAFDTTFRIGAYHAVSYHQLQHVSILALVTLVGVTIIYRRVRVHPSVIALFAPPMLLFLFRLATPGKHLSAAIRAIDDGLIAVNAIVLPVVLWVILRLLIPDYFGLPTWRLKIAVVATIALAAGIG